MYIERKGSDQNMYYAVSYSKEIYHFGIKERSGRYKYGSGLRPFQREKKYQLSFESYKPKTTGQKIKEKAWDVTKIVAKTTAQIAITYAISSALLFGVGALGTAMLNAPSMIATMNTSVNSASALSLIEPGIKAISSIVNGTVDIGSHVFDGLASIGSAYIDTFKRVAGYRSAALYG